MVGTHVGYLRLVLAVSKTWKLQQVLWVLKVIHLEMEYRILQHFQVGNFARVQCRSICKIFASGVFFRVKVYVKVTFSNPMCFSHPRWRQPMAFRGFLTIWSGSRLCFGPEEWRWMWWNKSSFTKGLFQEHHKDLEFLNESGDQLKWYDMLVPVM